LWRHQLAAPSQARKPDGTSRHREANWKCRAIASVMACAISFASAPGTAAAESPPAPLLQEPRQLLQVGQGRDIKTLAAAAERARDGATVEVDAGDYVGDVAVWPQNDLTLRAVGGRARLLAAGRAAAGKGIWVMRGERVIVQGFDFSGAAVTDRNGAGIRLDRGSLRVIDCTFTHNEIGILTNNDPHTVLEVESSEFAHNFRPDGHNHNLYAGTIARLSVTGSYFHHARTGHLLKSRARTSWIAYNRLSDGRDGSASYELEFPNGGVAYVIGNIIQQSADTQNPRMVSFGAEGYRWPTNALYLVNNTLIDELPHGGIPLAARLGATGVRAFNNLLVSPGARDKFSLAHGVDNVQVDLSHFERSTNAALQLKPGLPPWGPVTDPGSINGVTLLPQREYRHPRRSVALQQPVHQSGAVQSTAAASATAGSGGR
jgi:hypothetical protein